jgi:MGT family glycosyltransferase
MDRLKIFIITLPYTGHINPLFGGLKTLKNENNKIVIYSIKKFKNLIEQNGMEFRDIDKTDTLMDELNNVPTDNIKIDMSEYLRVLFKYFEIMLPQIGRDILDEKPDVVLYDDFAMYAKLIVRFLKENQDDKAFLSQKLNVKLTGQQKLPKFVAFITTFPNLPNVYPDEELSTKMRQELKPEDEIIANSSMEKLMIEASAISLSHRIKFKVPLDELMEFDPQNLLLVFTFPELQPKVEFFDKKMVKFVGSCIADLVRLNGDTSDDIEENDFENQILENNAAGKRLVYVSLGTVYNAKTDVFETLIEAFNSEDLQAENLHVIIATGETVKKSLTTMIENESLRLSENIKLVSFAPQMLILKHAKLFVTHSGFNSTKEAILFGVPMICLPISADQPLIANRICADLKLGLELDVTRLSVNDVVSSAQQILNDSGYYDRCAHYSKLSQIYDGPKIFASEIRNYLKE